jgi:hypothetical protein
VRRLRPSLLVFAVALLASLGVHVPVYEVLGALAEVLLHAPKPSEPSVVEFELAPLAATPHAQPVEPKPEPAPDAPEPEAAPTPEPPKPEAPTPKPAEPEPQLAMPQPPMPVVPPPEIQSQQAVEQKSDDPSVPAPENARFIAEENRRVLEETNATVRSFQKDESEPTPAPTPSEATEDKLGDAEEAEVADLQDVEGSRERTATEREAAQQPQEKSEASAGEREAAAVARAEPPPLPVPTPTREAAPAQASGAPTGGEEETLIVSDAFGSFAIRKRAEGRGEGDHGGALTPGLPAPDRKNRARTDARAGRKPNLQLSWSQFEQAFGEEQLRAEREQYVEQRRSAAEGRGRQQRWKKFRSAIENFLPTVQPGTQTALNAAASPFASYLAAVHRRIHREYAHGFLAGLPMAGGPFGDRTLNTTLEIVLNGDGSVHEVGVVKTSGFMPFDYGAFDAVMRAAPYPPAPRSILSGDGRVYVHWGFHRNERQCGTFNARPFILPNPDGSPPPGGPPLRDEGEGDVPAGPLLDVDE